MSLPTSVVRRAMEPLATGLRFPMPEHSASSLPLSKDIWNGYLEIIQSLLSRLAEVASGLDLANFRTLKRQAGELSEIRKSIYARLSSLSPFEYFSEIDINGITQLLNVLVCDMDEIIAGDGLALVDISTSADDLADSLPFLEEDVFLKADALKAVFEVDVDLLDDRGDFRAEWVLAEYAYQADELFKVLWRHLQSLGISNVTDQLAATAIIGGIVSSRNPVLSFDIMSSIEGAYASADNGVARRVADYLREAFASRNSTLKSVDRVLRGIDATKTSIEDRSLALAETYRRILEGPFRQFVWSYRCLQKGLWEKPPTIGLVVDGVVSAGGIYAELVKNAVLRELRNGAAHETLYWDGGREVLVTEGVSIDPAEVLQALGLMVATIQGSEVGWALCRASRLNGDESLLPQHEEVNRMPNYDRVRAFFGTNNLRLIDADLNRREVVFRVEQIMMTDINPAFQALLLAHKLLPDASDFQLLTKIGDDPVLSVSREFIECTFPVWEYAIDNIDRMPLSVFLPMNYNARLHYEQKSAAIRSVAWIAIDDLLDAIDGSPAIWGKGEIDTLVVRLSIVYQALDQLRSALAKPEIRLESVLRSADAIQCWLTGGVSLQPESVEKLESMQRLRKQWDAWGPVSRHPKVENFDPPADWSPIAPKLRLKPLSSHYITF